jgi:ABC-type antimicrobial peptide transport system permease subunit
MVVGQGMGLGIAGLAIGIAGAVLAGRAVGGLLYGVRSLDPLTFVLVPLALSLVTLAACARPARRATKVDPIVTLGR